MIKPIKLNHSRAALHSVINTIDITFKAVQISPFHSRKINNFCITLVFLSLLVPSMAYTEPDTDFQAGVEAYIKGDIKTAVQKFKIAAEQEEALAQFNLGLIYSHGHGIRPDYKEALKWYRLAADQGQAEAQSNLGWMYRNGLGVQKDYKEALRWYKLAADQGQTEAQWNLGLMHLNGLGTPQDYVQAYMWFNLSGVTGNRNAVRNRVSVEKRMTPLETAEAQRLAREWRPKR